MPQISEKRVICHGRVNVMEIITFSLSFYGDGVEEFLI